ncbi:hypothetical protein SAMN06295945_0337 [Polynucleobacter meluiroseus]|uniref:Transmembrane protein n=1 Tax=Polynucleobacter meluiroseus TaxID=1938814 RepID=A0A240DXU3_9BURK|nr:BPSS1780 family membrane protein [Polynucleobacter meluiroseus]SNX28018.1 hypothetical protein SAMN06295945_0337 [Polynucleobacter meluiroseus]
MKLHVVAAKEGYIWIRQGIWLFKQNPLGFLMLVFMYVLAAQLAVLVPIIGVFIVLLFTPTLSVGFMTACRQAIQKERIRPSVYLAALQASPLIRRRILQLGLVYTALILVLSFILSFLVDVELLIPLVTSDKPISPEAMNQLYLIFCMGSLLYVPIGMLMWFSPVLVAWSDMSVPQALFSSWLACWANRGAFLVYLLILGVALVAIPFSIGAFFEALDLVQVASYLNTPITLLSLTVMHCSFFAAWKACLAENETSTLLV